MDSRISEKLTRLKKWVKTYGLKNVILRGIYSKAPILPISNNDLLRRMNWQFKCRKQLDKYLIVSETDTEKEFHNKYPDTVWWLWLQGSENAPQIVKKCLETAYRYAAVNGYKLVELSEANLFDYVSIPDYVVDKWRSGKIGNANFSDICRISLLAEWGGIWVDSTAYLTAPIDPEILDADFFVFQASFLDLSATKISNWFIACKNPGNRLALAIRDSLFNFWKYNDEINDYFIFHLIVAQLMTKSDLITEFENIPYYTNTYPQLLLTKLGSKYDENIISDIIGHSFIHKLTYKGEEELIGDCENVYNFLMKREEDI